MFTVDFRRRTLGELCTTESKSDDSVCTCAMIVTRKPEGPSHL